jgi:hypothetical protein
MDFLFHITFFCTAAAAVAEILTVCFVNIEFGERKKLILKFSFRPNVISRVPKLPEFKQSLIRAQCQRPYAMLKAPVPSITVVKQH